MRSAGILIAMAFIAASFSAPATAGFSRQAQMSGYDQTYHSTGPCVLGACRPKNPYARRIWPSHQR